MTTTESKADATGPRYRNECPHCVWLGEFTSSFGTPFKFWCCSNHDGRPGPVIVSTRELGGGLDIDSPDRPIGEWTPLGCAVIEARRRGLLSPSAQPADAKPVSREEMEKLVERVAKSDALAKELDQMWETRFANYRNAIADELAGIRRDVAQASAAPAPVAATGETAEQGRWVESGTEGIPTYWWFVKDGEVMFHGQDDVEHQASTYRTLRDLRAAIALGEVVRPATASHPAPAPTEPAPVGGKSLGQQMAEQHIKPHHADFVRLHHATRFSHIVIRLTDFSIEMLRDYYAAAIDSVAPPQQAGEPFDVDELLHRWRWTDLKAPDLIQEAYAAGLAQRPLKVRDA